MGMMYGFRAIGAALCEEQVIGKVKDKKENAGLDREKLNRN